MSVGRLYTSPLDSEQSHHNVDNLHNDTISSPRDDGTNDLAEFRLFSRNRLSSKSNTRNSVSNANKLSSTATVFSSTSRVDEEYRGDEEKEDESNCASAMQVPPSSAQHHSQNQQQPLVTLSMPPPVIAHPLPYYMLDHAQNSGLISNSNDNNNNNNLLLRSTSTSSSPRHSDETQTPPSHVVPLLASAATSSSTLTTDQQEQQEVQESAHTMHYRSFHEQQQEEDRQLRLAQLRRAKSERIRRERQLQQQLLLQQQQQLQEHQEQERLLQEQWREHLLQEQALLEQEQQLQQQQQQRRQQPFNFRTGPPSPGSLQRSQSAQANASSHFNFEPNNSPNSYPNPSNGSILRSQMPSFSFNHPQQPQPALQSACQRTSPISTSFQRSATLNSAHFSRSNDYSNSFNNSFNNDSFDNSNYISNATSYDRVQSEEEPQQHQRGDSLYQQQQDSLFMRRRTSLQAPWSPVVPTALSASPPSAVPHANRHSLTRPQLSPYAVGAASYGDSDRRSPADGSNPVVPRWQRQEMLLRQHSHPATRQGTAAPTSSSILSSPHQLRPEQLRQNPQVLQDVHSDRSSDAEKRVFLASLQQYQRQLASHRRHHHNTASNNINMHSNNIHAYDSHMYNNHPSHVHHSNLVPRPQSLRSDDEDLEQAIQQSIEDERVRRKQAIRDRLALNKAFIESMRDLQGPDEEVDVVGGEVHELEGGRYSSGRSGGLMDGASHLYHSVHHQRAYMHQPDQYHYDPNNSNSNSNRYSNGGGHMQQLASVSQEDSCFSGTAASEGW